MEREVADVAFPAASVAVAPTLTKLPVGASAGRSNVCSKGDSVKSATSTPSTEMEIVPIARLSEAVPDTVRACPRLPVDGPEMETEGAVLSRFTTTVAVAEFPNFKVTGTTLRTVKTASINDWGAICWANGKFFEAPPRENLEILDRVGGGDSFASGLIYGLMTSGDPQTAVDYGAAHGALAMTTPGDTTMATLKEVEKIMAGGGARVVR